MKALLRVVNWPLRTKMAALFVLASFLPSGIVMLAGIPGMRQQLMDDTAAELTARGTQLVQQLDGFHYGYRLSVDSVAQLPNVVDACKAKPADRNKIMLDLGVFLNVWPTGDPNIRGVAILDMSGRVTAGTEQALLGSDQSFHPYVRAALRGVALISDIQLAEAQSGEVPTIAYVAPVLGPDGARCGVAVLWVRAAALWDLMKQSNSLAGPGSFAVMFDGQGIRVAHTYSEEIVFHPGGRLAPAAIDALVAERRFGARTRQLLEDVRPFPQQFELALAEVLDVHMFHGRAPVNNKWNYGVAHRGEWVPWTVFYMVPENALNTELSRASWEQAGFASLSILIAVLGGVWFAAVLLKPVTSLSKATGRLAEGDLKARADGGASDELGRLGASFNSMAERIGTQATALQKARDELELRVQQRTADLAQTTTNLEIEIGERTATQHKLQAQLERLNLLQQITRAIGERQDEHSIFQAVVRSVEDQLPSDFCCVGLHDAASGALIIDSVGAKSESLALQLAMSAKASVAIDGNGLSRCMRGELVYEPNIEKVPMPFPQRLAGGGLRALVAAPLRVESKVFGVLVVARLKAESFSSGECEFLQQLSEHVALAAHQAQIYSALEQAYDDLRQSQQVIQQQERLRSLGQMASGIAHDINNAISPVTLYTETLLEKEPNLSPRTRDYLEVILRSMEDVAQTVGRLREFYRQREAQATLLPIQLNALVEQVIDLTRARWHDMPQQRGVVIELHRDLAPDLPVALGVESEIREALTNLVFNAVDAMPEGGTLTLRTRPAVRQHVCIEVRDTGIGMDEETSRRCLEPFFTTKGERGTGLGLAMVYGIVQRHGAEIEIESVPGRGTVFRITFAVPEKGASVRNLDAGLQPDRIPVLRLLVIDDDPLLIRSLRAALESDGHTVVTANGGQSGIDQFRASQAKGEPFAAVISDLGMPHVDGRKVASAIKAASPSTPVILLTGWGQRMLVEGEVPPHVDRVLSKPPKLRELRAALLHCSQLARS